MEERAMTNEILVEIKRSVTNGQAEETTRLTENAIQQSTDPLEILNQALLPAVRELGAKFEQGEAFITDLIMAANALKAGYSILRPRLSPKQEEKVGRFLIGTVEGDIHDIGKEIVRNMLEAYGFEVEDLGVEVPAKTFVEMVMKHKPNILGMSALLTTTMVNQRRVIEDLKKAGIRENVKVMIGGAPTTEEWATEIGADAHGIEAVETVKKAIQLLGKVGSTS